MMQKNLFIVAGLTSFLSFVQACTIMNITCSNVKTDNGFELQFNPIMALLQMEVTQNGTKIATYNSGQFNFSPEVVHNMDQNSITTHYCRDLQVTSIVEKEGGLISEICVSYIVTDDTSAIEEEHQSSTTVSKTSVGPGVILIVLVVVVATGLGYIPWKKKRESATDNIQDDNARNYETEQSCLRTDNRDGAEADGQNMDNAIDMDGDVPTTNGNIRVSVVSGDRIHQGMNGNMGLDSGSGRISKKHSNGNRWTLGAQSPVGQKAKEPASPPNQRSAKSDSQTAAQEAIELVDSRGPGSESSTPPDNVEKGLTSTREL